MRRDAMRAVVQRPDGPAPLCRFPYLVIFRDQAEATYVVAVFHANRYPQVWQQRTS